jgi:hypothetical protein
MTSLARSDDKQKDRPKAALKFKPNDCGSRRWLTIAEALRPESQLNCYQFLEPDVAIIWIAGGRVVASVRRFSNQAASFLVERRGFFVLSGDRGSGGHQCWL